MSDCCSVPVNHTKTGSQCRLCGQKGRKVRRLTLEHLLKEPALARLTDRPYSFCTTSACSVVYYSNETNSYFHIDDVNVRVGLKETEDPVPICYCFGFTEKMALDEIRQRGYSTIPDTIRAEIKAGNCACEIENPSGGCCLGAVVQLVGKNLSQRSSDTDGTNEQPIAAPDDGCCASRVGPAQAISE